MKQILLAFLGGEPAPCLLLAGIWTGLTASLGALPAQGQRPTDFATEEQFFHRLRQPIQVRWSRAPLRSTLERLSRTQGLAIFLDRRLDPQRPLELRLSTTDLGDAIEQLARSQGAGVSLLPPLVYLGPQSTTRHLATVWELNRRRIQQLDGPTRQRWQSTTATHWPVLAEPRQLVALWTRQRGVVLIGGEQIPHDLWAAQQLPPMDLLQQLTVALAGFDLTVSVDSLGRARVVPMPEQVALTQTYALSDAQWADWPRWSESLTGTVAQRTAGRLSLTGRVEDHRRVASWLQGPAAAADPATVRGEKRYTLTVQNQPCERVLNSLAQQLDRELRWKGVGEAEKSQRVSLQLQNATLDELLRAVLRDTGLTYRLVARSLIVSRQDSPKASRPVDNRP